MTHVTQKAPRKLLTTSEAARILGVTREHLTQVLHSQRVSPKLLRRYERLARIVVTLGAKRAEFEALLKGAGR
ncbi:MAG: hypothetical protein NTY01_12930 [Verrucomicrobia bacterium]|nr:hypothetical protein [Verrucomicrobiota bacterium]